MRERRAPDNAAGCVSRRSGVARIAACAAFSLIAGAPVAAQPEPKPIRWSEAAIARHAPIGWAHQRLILEGQPEGENAWEMVAGIRAMLLAVEQGIAERAGNPELFSEASAFDIVVRPHEFTAEQREWAVATVREAIDSGVYAQIEVCALRPRFEPPVPSGPLIDRTVEWLGVLRWMGRALAARARLAGEAGLHDEVVACIDQLLRLSVHAAREPSMIGRLVGVGVRGLAMSAARTWIETCEPPEPASLALLDAIRASPLPPIGLVAQGERLFAMDSLEIVRGEGPTFYMECFASPSRLGKGEPPPPDSRAHGLHRGLERHGAIADEFFAALGVWISTPAWQRRSLAFRPDERSRRFRDECPLLAITTPAFERAVPNIDGVCARESAIMAALAVEVHRARTGSLPDSLDSLDATLLPASPADPFDGGLIKYRTLGDVGPSRPGYFIYSVGVDGTDDGAVELVDVCRSGGDVLLLGLGPKGTDHAP